MHNPSKNIYQGVRQMIKGTPAFKQLKDLSDKYGAILEEVSGQQQALYTICGALRHHRTNPQAAKAMILESYQIVKSMTEVEGCARSRTAEAAMLRQAFTDLGEEFPKDKSAKAFKKLVREWLHTEQGKCEKLASIPKEGLNAPLRWHALHTLDEAFEEDFDISVASVMETARFYLEETQKSATAKQAYQDFLDLVEKHKTQVGWGDTDSRAYCLSHQPEGEQIQPVYNISSETAMLQCTICQHFLEEV